MSLEAALLENTKALTALVGIMTQTQANQERLLAGQQAAIDKIEGAKASGRATPKDKTVDKPSETKTETKTEPKTETKAKTGTVTDDMVKAAAAAWTNGKTTEEKKALFTKVNEMLDFFGLAGSKITGPESKLDDEQRKQTLFFIKRWSEGLEVNFSADYDFDGDPCQEVAGDEGEEESPF